MAKPVYNTKINRVRVPSHDAKTDVRTSRVDVTGFVSKEKRIAALIAAGERLSMAGNRYDQFDTESEDIDSMEVDPTRNPGFDPVDAQRLSEERVIPAIERVKAEAAKKSDTKQTFSTEKQEKEPEKGE